MTGIDMPLPEPPKGNDRLALEVHRLMNHYRIDNGDELYRTMRAIVAAEVAKERERIRAAIMAKHEAANGQHNLYHCLAVELFGDEAIRAAAPPQCTSAPSEPQ